MDERLLERYSRQILLPDIDVAGQEKLLDSRVLVIGAGGLGSPVALYLAGSGVGHIVISDDDRLELSNLHRQIVHAQSGLGHNKACSAADSLRALNADITVTPLPHRLEGTALRREVAAAQVVVDCSDNFPSRHALNAACLAEARPLVCGMVSGLRGQLSVFRCGEAASPCLACLYPPGDAGEDRHCEEQGILPPAAGVIGSLQALATLKLLLGMDDGSEEGSLLLFDGERMETRRLRLRRDPHCPECGPLARHAKHAAM